MKKADIANTGRRAPALEALRVNLIVRRAQTRLSQDDLAGRSGVSRPTISRIERGAGADASIDVVQRLADALDITVAELFVSAGRACVDEDELARRAVAADETLVEARALLDAIDEASGIERYSRAGQPPVAR